MTSQLANPLETLRAPGTVRHFINGAWTESADGQTFETLSPATNEPIARVAKGSDADLQRAIAAAREAFDNGPWPRMRPADRAKILRKVGDLITERAPEIARIETIDTGLPIAQTGGAQIPRAADNFYFFAEMASHMDGRAFHNADYLNYTIQRPIGVAGLITPWNLPFMLTSWKVAPCLASGCTAVVKPASWTPLSNEKLAECIRDAGVPDGVYNLVYGAGETIGMGMVRSPQVQAISFTGETVTGKAIMREGAATMKRFSMELGGKSPIVVFADADYDRALDAAVFGVYSLNGERCTASSRCLVERSIYDRFVADLAARVEKIRVGDPLDKATEIGSLIHPNHLASVLEYVEIGKAEGARLVTGGGRVPGLEGATTCSRPSSPTWTTGCGSRRRRSSGRSSSSSRSTVRRRLSASPATSSTASPATSGRATSRRRTGSRSRSSAAWSGSTRRMCATCGRPSAARRRAASAARAATTPGSSTAR
jgi:5-carboxymethyl-2-hydroxymuconic-semialdehyde dehydrogenase